MSPLSFINIRTLSFPPIAFTIEREIPTDFIELPFARYVRFEDEVIEGNFRIVETYLPELLYVLAKENTGNLSMAECLILVGRKNLYNDAKRTTLILHIRMCQLFEALLFGDLFVGVWNGQWSNRCYAGRDGDELTFFRMHEINALTRRLLEILTISNKGNQIRFSYLTSG